jgi:hypothetical protein
MEKKDEKKVDDIKTGNKKMTVTELLAVEELVSNNNEAYS